MAIKINKFKSGVTANWKWPVNVGLVNSDQILKQELLQDYFTKRYSNVQLLAVGKELQISKKDLNLLIFPFTVKQTIKLIHHIQKGKWRMDGIIIISKNIRQISKPDVLALKNLQQLVGGLGIFVIQPKGNISQWYSDTIIQLSHNINLIDALKSSSKNGYFLIDPVLTSQATISHVISNMISTLEKSSLPLRIDVPLIDKKEIKAKELAKFLIKNRADFVFELENDAAKTIADLAKIVERNKRDIRNEKTIKPTSQAPPHHIQPRDPSGPRRSAPIGGRPRKAARRRMSTRPSREKKERTMLTQFIDLTNNTPVNYLLSNSVYSLNIKIGTDEMFIAGDKPFPDKEVFDEKSNDQEKIQIKLVQGKQPPQTKTLLLPRNGNSKLVSFSVKTGSQSQFQCELYAYHRNRLIQKALLTSKVFANNSKNSKQEKHNLQIVFSAAKDLSNLDKREPFGASLYYQTDNTGPVITGMTHSEPIDLYHSKSLVKIIEEIKEYIQIGVTDLDVMSNNLRDEHNTALLRKLALKGNALLVNHLGKKNKVEGPVQIISKRTEFVQLDFVYELPPPDLKAELCDHAEKALKKGKCQQCFNQSDSPAPAICPLGFWGLSRVIERHATEYTSPNGTSVADYQVLSASDSMRGELKILNNTVHACTSKIDPDNTGMRGKLSDLIQKSVAKLNESETWEDWLIHTKGKKPDSILLIVHVDHDSGADVDKLEIGNGSFLVQNYLDNSRIGTAPPFIVIIGCEVTNTQTYGFDISNQLMNHGAAIVVSNFTKIRGRNAVPVVTRLIELLKEYASKPTRFGEVLLKLRQQLLADGLIVSLSLMAHGDADWKIHKHV